MNEQVILKLKEAFEQTEKISFRGKTIFKTPLTVKSTLRESVFNKIVGGPLIQGSVKWKPSIHTPRVEYLISATEYIESLGSDISYSRLDFPDSCCKCMSSVTHYELVELCSKQILGKTRIWYAIPFCKEHNLESKAITIDIKGSANNEKVVIDFTNKEYGRLFGERNSMVGSWLTPTVMTARVLAPIGILLGAVMILLGSVYLYDNLVGFGARIEKELDPIASLPISLLIIVVGLVLVVWLTSFWIKNRKGEKL
jgi:hypothetical protein